MTPDHPLYLIQVLLETTPGAPPQDKKNGKRIKDQDHTTTSSSGCRRRNRAASAIGGQGGCARDSDFRVRF
ncbi:hypothetical protein K439DRAFT_1634424 [Ramaria rubella]|nr:hypothetical protein K439DRAFT_1634424 [Ramaria rubella]